MNEVDLKFPHHQLSSVILGCCFAVMNELGIGFLESVVQNTILPPQVIMLILLFLDL